MLAVGVLALLALDLVILTIYTALEQTLGGEVAKLIPNMEVRSLHTYDYTHSETDILN